MKIEVLSGTGQGPTELAAFDAAETQMGVGDCNLIRLSSVIPPGAQVVELDGPTTIGPKWGDKLYCVYADNRTSRRGEEVWAGVGWIMLDEGKGLFCEHEGNSRSIVERLIADSLMNFMKTRGLQPDPSLVKMRVAGTTCGDGSACALVMAAYRAEGW
jgi:arginine decarboxylase